MAGTGTEESTSAEYRHQKPSGSQICNTLGAQIGDNNIFRGEPPVTYHADRHSEWIVHNCRTNDERKEGSHHPCGALTNTWSSAAAFRLADIR